MPMTIAWPIVWLVAIVLFVVAEAATLGLTSIWFACGALLVVAMVAATWPFRRAIALEFSIR